MGEHSHQLLFCMAVQSSHQAVTAGIVLCHRFPDVGSARCLQARALEDLSILAHQFGSRYCGGRLPVFSEGLDLADILKAGFVAHLSSCAGLRCIGNLKPFFFFFLIDQSEAEGKFSLCFSLLQ